MNNEVDIVHEIKRTFMKLFPNAQPGNNGDIKSFSSIDKELHSLVKGVGIRSLAGINILKLTGNDVLDFLHRISTNDLKNLGVFRHKNTLFTNEKGRLIERATLLKMGDYFLLIGSADPDEHLKSWIEKYIIMEDIVVEDVSNNFTFFEIYGNQVESYIPMLCGNKISELNFENIIAGEIESIKSYVLKLEDVNELKKYWILTPSDDSISCINYLEENKSAFDLNFIGDKAFNHFRIINGIPLFPYEINTKYNPYEVNLIHEVNFKKGCYIGQEVIARLDTYDKVQRLMKGIKFELTGNFSLPIKLKTENNEEVGEITSISQTELNNQIIGLAIIRKKALESDNKIFAEINETEKVDIQILDFPIEQ